MQKILVVEDDQFLSSVLTTELKNKGYEIFAAYDGEQAVSSAVEHAPDLILLDLLLPRLDGYGALEKLKGDEKTKAIPVIVLSNLGQPDEIERARTLGADDFLVKVNFTPSEIFEKIKSRIGEPAPAAQQ